MSDEIGLAASAYNASIKEAKTGEKCPQGGTWHPKDCPSSTRSIGVGNKMPPASEGCSEVWVLKTPTGDN